MSIIKNISPKGSQELRNSRDAEPNVTEENIISTGLHIRSLKHELSTTSLEKLPR